VRRVFLVTCALLLAGCANVPPLAEWKTGTVEHPFGRRGGWAVTEKDVSEAVSAKVGDCKAVVEQYEPQGDARASSIPLVFAHGYLRDVANHRDHARHIASWGVPVYLVGHCSGGWSRNVEGIAGGGAGVLAQLMRQVADHAAAPSVVYGGFSAGGRASRIAALADPRSVGWLGLDPVDGAPKQKQVVGFPMYALFAPPQGCNAQQVGRAMTLASSSGMSLEVVGSTHCHFEAPSNFLCRAACTEPGGEERNAELRNRITLLATAWVRWRAGLDRNPPDALWREVQGVLSLVSQ
jgi:pimeloyl-ACP methyl ester carboxylesterase